MDWHHSKYVFQNLNYPYFFIGFIPAWIMDTLKLNFFDEQIQILHKLGI